MSKIRYFSIIRTFRYLGRRLCLSHNKSSRVFNRSLLFDDTLSAYIHTHCGYSLRSFTSEQTQVNRTLYNATTKEYTWSRSGYLYSLLLLLDIIMLSRRGSLFNVLLIIVSTGWPKKVSHYRESSLNRIKNRQPGQIFHQI